VKTVLGILLGLMLLTSLVGISSATPTMQPAQGSSCNPNSPNYSGAQCGANSGGTPDPHPHCNAPMGKDTDGLCCFTGITPHGSEISDIQPDLCVPP